MDQGEVELLQRGSGVALTPRNVNMDEVNAFRRKLENEKSMCALNFEKAKSELKERHDAMSARVRELEAALRVANNGPTDGMNVDIDGEAAKRVRDGAPIGETPDKRKRNIGRDEELGD